jgi:hypothetical protein
VDGVFCDDEKEEQGDNGNEDEDEDEDEEEDEDEDEDEDGLGLERNKSRLIEVSSITGVPENDVEYRDVGCGVDHFDMEAERGEDL